MRRHILTLSGVFPTPPRVGRDKSGPYALLGAHELRLHKESRTAAVSLGGRDAARSCQNRHELAIRLSGENGGRGAAEQQWSTPITK